MNTKFLLFSCPACFSYDTTKVFDRIQNVLKNFREGNTKYTFDLPIPLALVEEKGKAKIERKAWFSNKIYFTEDPYYFYYLVFDKILTEQELNLWRMFKMGRSPGYR